MLKFVIICCFTISLVSYAQIQEDMTVVYRDLRVHVTDASGQPVRGLTMDDFEFMEMGETLTPDQFEEVDLGATMDLTKALPLRRYLFVIESNSMYPGSFQDAVNALRDWVRTQWPPEALVKVVRIEDKLIHLTPFTANKGEVLEALKDLKPKNLLWKKLFFIEKETMRNISTYSNDFTGQKADMTEVKIRSSLLEKARLKRDFYFTFYKNMMLLSSALKSLSGNKSVFLLTGGSYLENAGNEFDSTRALADNLNESLNDAGATVYAILGKSPSLPHEQAIGIGAQSAALPNVGGLSASRLKSMSWFPPGDQGTPAMNTVLENGRQQESGPFQVAKGTGGFFMKTSKTKPYSLKLNELYNTSNHFYRIGYTRIPLKDAPSAEIKVVVHNADAFNWDVKYGKNIAVRKAWSAMELDEKILDFDARLLYGDVANDDLNCQWDYAVFPNPDGGFLIAMFLKMKVDEKPKEGIEIGFAASGLSMEILDAVNARYKPTQDGETVLVYDLLASSKPPTWLRFFARDKSTGKASFYRAPISLDDNPMSKIFFVSSSETPLTPLYRQKQKKKAKTPPKWDPFVIGDNMLNAEVGDQFTSPASIGFFFYVHDEQSTTGAYAARAVLRGVDTALPAGLKEVPAHITGANKVRQGWYVMYGSVSAAGLRPGSYALQIRITEPESGRQYQQSRELRILGLEN